MFITRNSPFAKKVSRRAVCSFPPLSEAEPFLKPELKLELIQTQMAQKPMLRAEV